MPKLDIPALIPGDHVRCGARMGVVKLSYPRKSDGQRFLLVSPADGPDEWAWKQHWEPLIHWVPDGLTWRCRECEREFRAGLDEFGRPRLFCRTCQRLQDAEDRARASDATPSHQFGARANRPRRRE